MATETAKTAQTVRTASLEDKLKAAIAQSVKSRLDAAKRSY